MAAKRDQAPAIEVRGLSFHVDEGFAGSWAALKMLRRFNSPELGTMEKLDLSLELIEAATGLTEEDIVEAAGGPGAPARDVVNLAMDIVRAVAPKN